MADSDLLMELTANVAPVTDNYPARISSRAVGAPEYVQLYDSLMDEGERLERFRSSDLVSRLWPVELQKSSERYFQYDRMIKNHFTAGNYYHQTDPYGWESIDDLLTDTSLTTLPLWLLGSDQDVQEIVSSSLKRDGYQDNFALDLARKHASERDYETALRYVTTYMTSNDDASQWVSNFHLYLLAKNGMLAQARPLIENLEALGRPGTERFLDWFETRFELRSAESR
jgi:hypothetical protein